MKVILIEDVKNLGRAGDTKVVADGFARNMLFPRGWAVEATPRRLQELERRRQSAEQKARHQEVQAREIADRLEGTAVNFRVAAGEGGRLFGSITAQEVAAALQAKGFDIDKKKLILEEPLKNLGEHQVVVKLCSGVRASIRVYVEKEG